MRTEKYTAPLKMMRFALGWSAPSLGMFWQIHAEGWGPKWKAAICFSVQECLSLSPLHPACLALLPTSFSALWPGPHEGHPSSQSMGAGFWGQAQSLMPGGICWLGQQPSTPGLQPAQEWPDGSFWNSKIGRKRQVLIKGNYDWAKEG